MREALPPPAFPPQTRNLPLGSSQSVVILRDLHVIVLAEFPTARSRAFGQGIFSVDHRMRS